MLRILPKTACRWSRGVHTIHATAHRRPHLRFPSLQIGHHVPRRAFIDIPTVILPPIVFSGLLVALWTWKCIMMVLFQNKIIYMPGLPPNARREAIADYMKQCGDIQWREERIRASDGTRISLCVASVDNGPKPWKTVYILYFQGNASSLPPRLPLLSPVLRILQNSPVNGMPIRYTLVCCSYRGYWTSNGRPSEKGIAKDASAALDWIKDDGKPRNAEQQNGCGKSEANSVIFWGQSIGAGVATNLAAQPGLSSERLSLRTLILETPFVSIRSMLETLYPQKWLPYRYLWPFLWNHLDSWSSLGAIQQNSLSQGSRAPDILILEAGKDELVPSTHGSILEERCLDLELHVRKQVIRGALHTEVMSRPAGRVAVVEAIQKVGQAT